MYLIAHRGLHSKNTRENTLEAVLLGDKNNCIDGVEIDVRLTKDNKVVVIHDDIIDRVSDGSGKVREMSLERLRRFNYGSIVKPSTINTLEEVLNKFSHNTLLVIELKDELDKNDILASKVLEIISNYPRVNIFLKSFSLDIVKYLKKYSSRPVGILINKNNINYLDIDVDFYSISKNVINSDIINNKMLKNKKIMIWTISSIEDMDNLCHKLNDQLDDLYIISDNPLMYCK